MMHKFFIGDGFTQRHLVTSLALILFITLLLRPAENFLRRVLDKKFFKGTIEEISEQKARLESELERTERLKSVGILAAGMAHEIKNPLTAIKTFAAHLPARYNDPEFREKFQKIVTREVDRVTDIVTNLLLFSRPSEPVRRNCDINNILKETLELLSGEIIKSGVQVDAELAEEALSFVDPGQMKQAFLNILLNALESMRPKGGGGLFICAKSLPTGPEVEIRDEGCGIPEEQLKSIFDPFYTNKESGTGLGLAVTHSIVEKNNGKITVRSTVGVGTVFTVMLPSAD